KEVASVDSPLSLLARIERKKVEPEEARRRLHGTLLGEGGTAALLITLSEDGRAEPRKAIQAIEDAAFDIGITESELRIGGEAVTANAIDEEVRKATWNTIDPMQHPPVFLISALCGLLAAFAALRSLKLGIVVIAGACLTALLTTTIIALSGHTMNMVLIVMPTLLVVLTLSAAIHLVNYWRHAKHEKTIDPIRVAISQGWRPCVLAAITTLIGLLSLLISELSPVRDFGLFSSAGVVLGLGIVLVGLPAMLRLFFANPKALTAKHGRRRRPLESADIWRRFGSSLAPKKRPGAVGSVILFRACTSGLNHVQTDVKVIHHFPADSDVVRNSQFIESHIGGLSPIEVLIQFDDRTPEKQTFLERMDFVRNIQDKLRDHPGISGAISLADFDTSYPRPGSKASTFKRMRYHRRSHDTERRIKNGEIDGTARYFAAPDRKLGEEWHQHDPRNEVWRISAQAYLLGDQSTDALTSDVDRIVGQSVAGQVGVGHVVTGSVPLFLQAQQAMLTSLTLSFALALAIIACTLAFMLGDIRSGIVSVLPCLMPVGIVFGLMSWNGLVLDIGTILTASVALGIAVDDTLHLLTWYRKGIANGDDQQTAVTTALSHCGPAMTQTTVVVSLSLLALYPSPLSLISQFGWVMAALLAVALLAELVLLPVLLLGPLGRWIAQRDKEASSGNSRRKVSGRLTPSRAVN
ncbi:MAG: RND family transporter, partial [Planctomycetaceae bacterium]